LYRDWAVQPNPPRAALILHALPIGLVAFPMTKTPGRLVPDLNRLPALEQILRYHGVDALHAITHLRHLEIDGHAREHVGLHWSELEAFDQERHHFACRHLCGLVEI